MNNKKCDVCNGTGKVQQTDIDFDECRSCNGQGIIFKEEHSSLCYGCDFARHTASDENDENGYVGCVSIFDQFPIGEPTEKDLEYIVKAEEIGTGWIRHGARIGTKINKDIIGHGIMSNGQIITKGVQNCKKYKEIE